MTDRAPKYIRLKIASIVCLLLLPFFSTQYIIYLSTVALIFSIFAIAYDFLYGYTGLVSFGHSAFYGVPAYAVGIASTAVWDVKNPLILISIAVVAGAVLGMLVGFFCTFSRGIYLALVTFAFAQIFWLLILADPGGMTLGENGIVGVRPSPVRLGSSELNLFAGAPYYYVVLLLGLVSYICVSKATTSQFGDVLSGIKQNEPRLRSLGYNTRPYKILVFCISGALSGMSGCLMAFLNNSVVPSMVDWHVGAEILLITILGGAGTLLGPVLSAFLIVFTESYASTLIGGGNWVYVMGCLYIAVVMFLEGGLLQTGAAKYLSQMMSVRREPRPLTTSMNPESRE